MEAISTRMPGGCRPTFRGVVIPKSQAEVVCSPILPWAHPARNGMMLLLLPRLSCLQITGKREPGNQAYGDEGRVTLFRSQKIKDHMLPPKGAKARIPDQRVCSLPTPTINPFAARSHRNTHGSLGIPDLRLLLHQCL